MSDVGQARLVLAALQADLDRARRSLDATGAPANHDDVLDDIQALMGALHHLVHRYNTIIDAADGRRR